MFLTTDADLAAAMERMRSIGTDIAEYEVKAAAGGFPKSTPESMCAFANTTGGTLIFGISEEKDFHAVTIDAKTIQSKLSQAARELIEPQLQIDILVLTYENKPVVVANIPESPRRQKPCFIKKLGLMNGSYIRTGDGDHKMSQYEIERYRENQLQIASHDGRIIKDATLEDFNHDLLFAWLARVREASFGRVDALSDEGLMANRRVISRDEDGIFRPTLAGLLALCSYPQKYFPRLCVVFTKYPTNSKGVPSERGMRFLDSITIDGSIPDMIVKVIRAVDKNIAHGAVVKNGLREEVPEYPLAAIREAIANALMHRDYSTEACGEPVTVDLYPDRLEISNPGGLFGPMTVERLGGAGATLSRNQFLSRILEDVSYTNFDGGVGRVVENRGSGYPTIRYELAEAGMSEPLVTSSLNTFEIKLLHRDVTIFGGAREGSADAGREILSFLEHRQDASTKEIAAALKMTAKTVRHYLAQLMEAGLVEGIGAPRSPKRRYKKTN